MIGRGNDRKSHVTCLRCADDWERCGGRLLKKHKFKDLRNKGKWEAAWREFLRMPPTEVDVGKHNLVVMANDQFLLEMAPILEAQADNY